MLLILFLLCRLSKSGSPDNKDCFFKFFMSLREGSIYVAGFHFSPTGLINTWWPFPVFAKPLVFTAQSKARDKSVLGPYPMVYLTEVNGNP